MKIILKYGFVIFVGIFIATIILEINDQPNWYRIIFKEEKQIDIKRNFFIGDPDSFLIIKENYFSGWSQDSSGKFVRSPMVIDTNNKLYFKERLNINNVDSFFIDSVSITVIK